MALNPGVALSTPSGLWLLAALLPLVGAYFLRRKQPPRRVSALFLWRLPNLRAEGGPRLDRLSRERSLLLECLMLLLGTLYLAHPHCGGARADAPPVALVLDGSLSMQARTPGGDAIRDAVAPRVNRLLEGPGTEGAPTLVQSGGVPRVLAGPRASGAETARALAAYRPLWGHHAFLPALELARNLSGAARVVLITDRPPAESLPGWVAVESVGQPLENDAITFAARRDEGERALLTLRVQSFRKRAVPVTLRVKGEPLAPGRPFVAEERTLRLLPGGSERVELRLTNVRDVEVRLSSPGDALEEDDQVVLRPTPPREVSVALRAGLTEADLAAVQRFLTVAEGFHPSPTPAADLIFGPPGSDAEVTLGATGDRRAFLGPFFAEKTEPLLEDVSLDGVVWSAGTNPPGRPLLSAGPRWLLTQEESGRVHLNLDLARSNVQRTAAWPILLANLGKRARSRLPGFAQREIFLGQEAHVQIPAEGSYRLEGPGLRSQPLRAGALTLPPFPEPGSYRVLRNDTELDSVRVLAVDAQESDLREAGPYRQSAPAELRAAKIANPIDRRWWPLVTIVGLLLLDLRWTQGRR